MILNIFIYRQNILLMTPHVLIQRDDLKHTHTHNYILAGIKCSYLS